MKVLLAEDDLHTRNGLQELLEAEGYDTLAAADGAQALQLFQDTQPDFVLLDIMMPQHDGYDVCREIRRHAPEVPIIFISAKAEEIDRVIGLELGADDFIIKPFGTREVIARIRAVTRRCLSRQPSAKAATLSFGDLEIFPKELRARRGEQTIDLSLRDVRILTLLHANPGEVVARDTLFDQCWGRDYLPNSRTLDQHIAKLRKRIERDPRHPQLILTVHGVGYRYDG
ncbi:MAG: response regulator transcription factor [Candidatus Competibacteraceae bacterium]|jgi:DNA-binding response OmpR family regulator|nr:response regulator transcription factor [Candidatus Competibacteraceae bacterium]